MYVAFWLLLFFMVYLEDICSTQGENLWLHIIDNRTWLTTVCVIYSKKCFVSAFCKQNLDESSLTTFRMWRKTSAYYTVTIFTFLKKPCG